MSDFDDVRDASEKFLAQHTDILPALDGDVLLSRERKPRLKLDLTSNYPSK